VPKLWKRAIMPYRKKKPSKTIQGYKPIVVDLDGKGVLSEEELHKRYRLHQSGKISASPAEPSNLSYLRSAQLNRENGIDMAADFLGRLLNIDSTVIARNTDIDLMYERGDLILPYSRKNIEVKVRAVNPDRYPMNHVTLGIIKFDPRHPDGLKELSYKLGIDVEVIENSTVREFGYDSKESYKLGHPEHFSLTSHSLLSSEMTIYINPTQGHIYLYTLEEIKRLVNMAIKNSGIRKGQGGDEPDSLSVLIPLSRWRFTKDKNNLWKYTGFVETNVAAEKDAIRNFLT
jgi:hypothetical protein